MTIQKIINGTIYEFPDGTPEGVMRRFEAQKTVSRSPIAPAAPSIAPMAPGYMGHALQGLTMGFSDEAIAKARSMMDRRPNSYEDYLRAERQGLAKFGEENPISSSLAEIGGTLPTMFLGGAGAARAVPSIMRMAGVGAGAGAVNALGTTEKTGADLPGEAAMGAVTGAATAGGLGLAGKYIAMPAFRAVKRAFGFGDANKMADVAIARALEKDGLTPYEALAKIQQAKRGEITLADMGENTSRLLRNATQIPGEARRVAKDVLTQRESERIPRVSEDLRQLMSGSPDFHTDVADLIAKRRADADALYKAAYANPKPINESTAPEINKLRNLPSFQEAMKAGAKRAKDKGLDISDPRHTLEALHETKLALDDMISANMRSGNTNQARTLIDMRNKLVGDMETASPDYKIARQAFAGDSEMLDAMTKGKSIYELPEPEMRKLTKEMSANPSQYDAFRSGIAQAMLEKLRAGGAGADPMAKMFTRDNEAKIRRAFADDAAFDEFKARLMEESKMLNTEKAGFRRTPMDTDLDAGGSAIGAATALAKGQPMNAATQAMSGLMNRATGMSPTVANATTAKLLTPASQGLDPVMQSIMANLKAQEAALAQGAVASNVGGGLAAAGAASRPPTMDLGTVGGSPDGTPMPPPPQMAPPAAPAPAPLGALAQ
jgi:hypothetical protein